MISPELLKLSKCKNHILIAIFGLSLAFHWILYITLRGKAKIRAEVLKSKKRDVVLLTVRGGRLNIRTSIAPYINEFRLGKLERKVQTYLTLLQASLLGSFQQMVLALLVCCRYTEVGL